MIGQGSWLGCEGWKSNIFAEFYPAHWRSGFTELRIIHAQTCIISRYLSPDSPGIEYPISNKEYPMSKFNSNSNGNSNGNAAISCNIISYN